MLSLVLLFVFAEFFTVMAYGIQGINFVTLDELVRVRSISISISILAVVGDLIITALICISLHKSRTGATE